MGIAEYSEYDGLGLAELVRRGEVSPAELVEEAITRIDRQAQDKGFPRSLVVRHIGKWYALCRLRHLALPRPNCSLPDPGLA